MSIEKQEAYDRMNSAFQDGTFESSDSATLQGYLVSLANQSIVNSQIQHRDIIRGLTINHILLQRHIEGLNKQNTKTQRWVIALAVAALLSSVVQIFSPVFFPQQVVAAQPPKSSTLAASPVQTISTASGQATKKKP